MTPAETATTFTEMLKRGEHEQAAAQFNAPNIVSIENMDGPRAHIQGADAVKAKSAWWTSAHEVHAISAHGPYLNGDQFIVRFEIDVTVKETGIRSQMSEAGLYTVRDGKIVEERFFY